MKNAVYNYYEWLCELVGLNTPGYSCYGNLLSILFDIDFYYSIPMDENREIDGLYLRKEWADETGVIGDVFHDRPCSVLEVLAALGRSAEDIMGDPQLMLFWVFLKNLDLEWADDGALTSSSAEREVEDIVRNWLNREIKYDGSGGICPREHPECDQRDIEIWYQVTSWLSERYC